MQREATCNIQQCYVRLHGALKFENAYKRDRCRVVLLQIFRFEDQDDYDEEIQLEEFFSVILKKKDTSESFTVRFFSPETLAWLFLLQEFKPSTERKMIKSLTFDNRALMNRLLKHSFEQS